LGSYGSGGADEKSKTAFAKHLADMFSRKKVTKRSFFGRSLIADRVNARPA
jgi:hypothetical protein